MDISAIEWPEEMYYDDSKLSGQVEYNKGANDMLAKCKAAAAKARAVDISEVLEVYEKHKIRYDILISRGDKNIIDESLWNAIRTVANRYNDSKEKNNEK